MKRYRRFSGSREGKPVLFFVGAFALLTAMLAMVFVKVGTLPEKGQPSDPVATLQPVEDIPETPEAPTETEYDFIIERLIDSLLEKLEDIWGSPTDTQWDQRVQDDKVKAWALSVISDVKDEVLKQKVPASLKEEHFSLVLDLDGMGQGVKVGQFDIIQEHLLKLELRY